MAVTDETPVTAANEAVTTTEAAAVDSTVAQPAVTAAYDPATGAETAYWEGVLVVEGVTTGDRREFAPNSLTWAELPIPLRWNKEDSHGGEPHTVAVNVGRIDRIWRKKGGQIWGSGTFNLAEEDGQRAYQLVKDEYLSGVSVDVDDVNDADVEMVWPEYGPTDDESGDGEESAEADDLYQMLFGAPEKVIFHAGRIRAATLCDIPAFVEARVQVVDAVTAAAMLAVRQAFGPVETHETATSDGSWDAAANEKRLPSPVPASAARGAYAWLDSEVDDDGDMPKSMCRFIHHEVSADGTVGAANLSACSSGIGVLNGGRGGTTIPADDRTGVYEHLAAHLRDAGREPPELAASVADTITAGAAVAEAPPRAWFADPHLSVPTPITVLDDGRLYGHAATWGQCHVGSPDVCVTPPHEDGHPYFMTGELVTDDGTRVPVGQVVMGTRHAALSASPGRASDHYEDTGYAVADVTVGNDSHGIWVAGALRPWADPANVRALRGSGQLSGDWRRVGGSLRLVGLLVVNVPGFPVPRIASRVARGQQVSLVAAGARSFDRGLDEETAVQQAMRRILAQVDDRVQGHEPGEETR